MQSIHVVALALENGKGEILVTKRPNHKHQGGLWEFPGGKIEANETRIQALKREIKEEIDFELDSENTQALKCITHDYGDVKIKLDVWYSKTDHPSIFANENQQMKWVTYHQLQSLSMPAADQPIIEALMRRQ